MAARRRSRRTPPVRFHVSLLLTRAEIKQLQARAAAELRSVGNYVGKVIVDDLRRTRTKRRSSKARKPLGEPGDRRVGYDLTIQLSRGIGRS